jgi:hypothetical protein
VTARCAACRAEVAGDEEAIFRSGWVVDMDGDVLCPDCAGIASEEKNKDGSDEL